MSENNVEYGFVSFSLPDEELTESDTEEKFTCKFCEYETLNIDDLDEHIITHEEALIEETLQEEQIDKVEHFPNDTTDSASDFDTFEKGTKKIHVCPFCSFQTLKRTELATHLKVHEKPMYSCAECPYVTKRKHDINRHLNNHCIPKRDEPQVYKCDICQYKSSRKDHMKRHKQAHENGVGKMNSSHKYPCTECGYTTLRLCDLLRHAVLHCDGSVKGVYKCKKCDFNTGAGNSFAKHVLSNCASVSEPAFKCEKCPFGTNRKEHLVRHLRCHEGNGAHSNRDFIFSCTECGYTSKRLSDLHRHAVLHCDTTVMDCLKCKKCDYSTTVDNSFAKHILSRCKVTENSVIAVNESSVITLREEVIDENSTKRPKLIVEKQNDIDLEYEFIETEEG